MSEIAKAYVQIIPTAQGISGSISNVLDGEAESAGKSAGSRIASGIGGVVSTGLKAATAAITATTGAAVAFGTTAVNAGASFDSAMSQVAATMGKSIDEIQDLRDFAQEMGSKTAFSASEAAQALNYMALAGYDSEKSMKMLPTVLDLAAAGGIDLASASDMVTDAQSALGLSMRETEIMVNQMAAASSNSNTSVAQLGEAFLKIGATARNVSGGTRELSTVLGVLADNGIKGTEGGTHLRNILLSLQSAAEDGVVKFGDFSVSVYDADGNMRSMIDIIEEMQAGMGDMTQASKDALISGVFNKTDLAAVNALLGTSSERFDELTLAVRASSNAASNMANTQLDNLAGDVTIFKSALEGAQIAVSDQLTPTLREFVAFGTQGLSSVTEAFKSGGLNGAMEALGTVLSDGLSMLTQRLPDIVSAGAKLLGALVQGITDNIDVILEAATTIINDFVDRISQSAEGDGSFGETATKIISTLGELLIRNVPLLATSGLQFITNLANYIVASLPEAIPAIVELVQGFVQTLIDNAPALIEAGLELVSELTIGIAQAIPGMMPQIVDLVVTIVEKLTEPASLNMLLQAALEIILALAEGLVTAIPRLVAAVPQIISNLVGSIVAALPQIIAAGVRLLVSLTSGIIQAIPQLVLAVPSIITAIVGGLVQGIGQIIDTGGQLVNGLWEGIKRSWDNMVQNFKDLVGGLVDSVMGWFGIHSPSTVFRDEIGKWIPAGIAVGIDTNAYMVMDSMEALADDTVLSWNADISGKDLSYAGQESIGQQAALAGMGSITIPVYIGQKKIETLVVDALQASNYRAGGR